MKNIPDVLLSSKSVCFLSPHLDDALLSCSELITLLVNHGVSVTVITLFTDAGNIKNSFSAKQYLKQCGFKNARVLYKKRQDEDLKIFKKLNVKSIHLGYCDALWRTGKGFFFTKYLSKFLPELSLLYPTYKFHISKGHIHSQDDQLVNKIVEKLNSVEQFRNADVILGPVGIGNHVDHIITNKVLKIIKNKIKFYWADYPYNAEISNKSINQEYIESFVLFPNWQKKLSIVSQYKTQYKSLTNDHEFKLTNEIIFVRRLESTSGHSESKLFPKKIGEFNFVKELHQDKSPKPYLYAQYCNKKGVRAFAKIFIGNKKNKNYFSLKNEAAVLNSLNSAGNQSKSKNVRYPRILAVKENKNIFGVLFEFFDGTHIAEISNDSKIHAFQHIFTFFDQVNIDLHVKDSNVNRRGNVFWILVAIISSLKVITKNPKLTKLICKSNLFLIYRIPILLLNRKQGLVHRDIGYWNAFVANSQVYLYDFQLACIANPLLEHAATNLKLQSDKKMAKMFFEKITLPRLTLFTDLQTYLALSISLSLYELSLDDKKTFRGTIEYLDYLIGKEKGSRLSFLNNLTKTNVFKHVRLFTDSPKDYLYSYTYSNKEKVKIYDYDKNSKIIINYYLHKIYSASKELKVLSIGSAGLKIAGEKDIDLIASYNFSSIDKLINDLVPKLGKPIKVRKSFIQWSIKRGEHNVDFVIYNLRSKTYLNKIIMFEIIKENKKYLTDYMNLKKDSDGVSYREYDRRKMIFFNNIYKENRSMFRNSINTD